MPIPNVLIWAGLLFILLTFVSRIGGVIEVRSNRKRWTLSIGLLLLSIGIVLSFSPIFNQSLTPRTLPSGSLLNLKQLETYLKNEDFQNANQETGILLRKSANLPPPTKKRFEKGDSQKINCQDLKLIDTLWKKYSNNKFGISIQKNILLDTQSWDRLVQKVGWKQNNKLLEDRSQLTYNLSAPRGHLPGVLFWITDDSNFYDGISCNF